MLDTGLKFYTDHPDPHEFLEAIQASYHILRQRLLGPAAGNIIGVIIPVITPPPLHPTPQTDWRRVGVRVYCFHLVFYVLVYAYLAK